MLGAVREMSQRGQEFNGAQRHAEELERLTRETKAKIRNAITVKLQGGLVGSPGVE